MRSAALLDGVQARTLLDGILCKICRMLSTTVTVLPVPIKRNSMFSHHKYTSYRHYCPNGQLVKPVYNLKITEEAIVFLFIVNCSYSMDFSRMFPYIKI